MNRLEYIGAAVIFAGVTIALLPSFFEENHSSGDKVLFNMLYVASSLPAAFSVCTMTRSTSCCLVVMWFIDPDPMIVII
jgi:hypothetical protein